MASLTRWTWVWVNSGSWWWTGRPGVLWFMGSQRVWHDWVTDLIWSDAFSKSSLTIWEFSVHVVLKSSLENFEHYFSSIWNECNCVVVWKFFGIALLWNWDEDWPFAGLLPLLSFLNLLAYWVQHFECSIIFHYCLVENKWISSVAQWSLKLCNPMDFSTPGFLVRHQLPEPTQTHAYRVSDAIQPFHPLLFPSPPAFNLSQYQGLFQWVNSSHQEAK